jgi:Fe-S cluster assembly scaffold protein SufB
MSELNRLVKEYEDAGGKKGILADKAIPCIFASSHSILSLRSIEGVEAKAEETPTGIRANVLVKEGVSIEKPIYLCIGILHPEGLQEIGMNLRLEKDSSASVIAHCIFPKAQRVTHAMEARVEVGEGAMLKYSENHFHGLSGGVEVIQKAYIKVDRGGRYFSAFNLINGRVGRLSIDYEALAWENSIVELVTRVLGKETDDIKINEKVVLAGENSRGLIKARVALEGEARSEVISTMEGNAPGARGHMDCMEIVKDKAIARAIPIVEVSHSMAKVTHEAAIGTVDQRQLETLMAHGLTPDEAVDVIVKGILTQ